jgi:hypothetical protein
MAMDVITEAITSARVDFVFSNEKVPAVGDAGHPWSRRHGSLQRMQVTRLAASLETQS